MTDEEQDNPPETPPAPAWTGQHWRWLGLILLVALFFRGIALDFPHEKFFDEIYYVDAANDYLNGRADANSVHPPLAKIQLAATMLVFDVTKLYGLHHLDDVVGWRLAPMLCGVGVVGLTAWLAFALTGKPRLALLAALLMAWEHLSVAESRITTLDSIQTFWITLGICCAAQRIFRGGRDDWVIFSALAMGVATGCKWNGLFAAAGVGLALLGACWNPPEVARPDRALVVAAFAALIPTVYALAYVPYARVHPERSLQRIVTDVKDQHVRMWKFRHDPKQFKHQYLSPFYLWPFAVKPVWFYYKTPVKGYSAGIVAFGSIPFWWLSGFLLLELVAAAWRSKEPDSAGQFLVLTYFSQWGMWAASGSQGFFYYMLTVVPLMAVVVARQIDRWWESDPYLAGKALLVLGGFALAYLPFMTGWTVPYQYFKVLFPVPVLI